MGQKGSDVALLPLLCSGVVVVPGRGDRANDTSSCVSASWVPSGLESTRLVRVESQDARLVWSSLTRIHRWRVRRRAVTRWRLPCARDADAFCKMLADLVPGAPMSTTSQEKLNRMVMGLRALAECAPSVHSTDGVYIRRGGGAYPVAYAFWNRWRGNLLRMCVIPVDQFDLVGDKHAVRLGARRVTRRP
jgi:hypothetical protein